MGFRGALFDLDGTLLNSLEDIATSANAVLQAHGLPTHPLDAYRYFVGEGLTKLMQRILPEDRRNDGEWVQLLVAEFSRHYHQNWNVLSHLYDGVLEMLQKVNERGLRMAVLSNKPHEFTKLCVEYYLPAVPFGVVFGADAVGARKPDPAGAWEVARRLEAAPREIVYLGDTATDMETARRAGMYGVGATWGFRDAQELRDAGAQELVDHPMQLIEVIDRQQ